MTPLRRRMTEDMILRNLAPGTIRQYVDCVAGFARYFNTSPERLGPEQVRSYLLHLVQEHHVSWSYYSQVRSALQFLYRVTLGMDWVVEEVACPKVPKRLPVILSPDEVVRFFKAAQQSQAPRHPHDRPMLLACGSPRSAGYRSRTSTARAWSSTFVSPRGTRIETSCSPLGS